MLKQDNRSPVAIAGLFGAMFVLVMPCACCWSQNADRVDAPQWQAMEKEIAKEWNKLEAFDYSLSQFSLSSNFRHVLKNGTDDDFFTMIRDTRSDLIKLAGYRCIQEKYPARAYEAAISTVLAAKYAATGPFASVWQNIKDTTDLKTTRPVLKSLLATTPVAEPRIDDTLPLLVDMLPVEVVEDWHRENGDQMRQPILGSVLLRVFRGGGTPTDLMERQLEQCGRQSGWARFVYLSCAETDEPKYLTRFRECLSDSTIHDYFVVELVAKRKRFVEKHIDLDKLAIPENRKEFINRIMKRTMKSKPLNQKGREQQGSEDFEGEGDQCDE